MTIQGVRRIGDVALNKGPVTGARLTAKIRNRASTRNRVQYKTLIWKQVEIDRRGCLSEREG